ncbi:uncharacterized protein [Ptychodera flava]|uniref:uncharacterized protein n=1 Tax=Ptychodera flava TaxID=63121 RepID=UPI00396A6D9B
MKQVTIKVTNKVAGTAPQEFPIQANNSDTVYDCMAKAESKYESFSFSVSGQMPNRVVTEINGQHNNNELNDKWYFKINNLEPEHQNIDSVKPTDGDTIDWNYEHRD